MVYHEQLRNYCGLMFIRSDNEFMLTALGNYDNPACVDVKEFQSDLKRFSALNRCLIETIDWSPELHRRVLNNLLIIYNIFGVASNSMLRYKISESCMPKLVALSMKLNRYTEDLCRQDIVDTKFLEEVYASCK